ncbi:Gfo/Idh/MocA family oxidoreductase [Acetobacteraceae bacterium ESL0709]|nr:Gfo/Idh/MocA family oxidoreductase [Acetobacteraceae bacterium ESL0697]MDF7678047.1 Gfo/Idh/MocA family oxidoreductase [Acetobacteraceae bacterium ESL0709]
MTQTSRSHTESVSSGLPSLQHKATGRPYPNKTRPLASGPRKFGYAIVGLGGYAVNQILPAFADCQHARLAALVSGSQEKMRRLGKQYGIEENHLYSYEDYDRIAEDPDIDAVYIILPNSLHAEFTIRAFEAGKHVLCEKPMAVTLEECQRMIAAGKKAGKELMIGYRCHFDPLTHKAMAIARGHDLGALRMLKTTISHMLDPADPLGQWRLNAKLSGGGSLMDIGIYGINASRYLLNDEPVEVRASFAPKEKSLFKEVESTILWTMFYRSGVISEGSSSYDACMTSHFSLIGEKAFLDLDPATSYWANKVSLRQSGYTQTWSASMFDIEKLNQFSAQLDYLPISIAKGKLETATAEEGMQDIRLIQAIYESARSGRAVATDWSR